MHGFVRLIDVSDILKPPILLIFCKIFQRIASRVTASERCGLYTADSRAWRESNYNWANGQKYFRSFDDVLVYSSIGYETS